MNEPRTQPPIADYGLIGDTRSAALVGPDGSIDWCCLPRFDAPPVFGRLVGGADGGWFSVAPVDPVGPPVRGYRTDTTTLETTWMTGAGAEVTLADSMVADVSGRLLPATLVVRRIVASDAPARMMMELRPRFGYDRRGPRTVRRRPSGVVFERDGLAIGFSSDGVAWDEGPVTFVVDPARPVTIVLAAEHHRPLVSVPPAVARAEAERDEAGWRSWSKNVAAGSPHRHAIVRSLLTLQLLTYSPSGAPVAAPTTSLPEVVGGIRNWDYRYAWPRDASTGIAAFLAYGKEREARAFLAWLLHASRLDRPRLPALFTLDGRPGPREVELEGWPGYCGSRPVRVGNGAASQHQLDGYGWVIDAAWLAVDAGIDLGADMWRTIRGFADFVRDHWTEPDAGIWEQRGDVRHHVHSKVMAWLALDRAIRIAGRRGGRARRHVAGWAAARDAVAADVRARGYDDGAASYTASYGSSEVDASILLLPVIGLEPPGSPRVQATIAAVQRQLEAGGPLLYRYRGSDGLTGSEGAFLPCSFWLVQALATTGRGDEAHAVFAELLELGRPLGLYAEEADPATMHQVGNFPQALTHAALLQAAQALDALTPREPTSDARAAADR